MQRMCLQFYCDARGDRYCCADCYQRRDCANPCMNHPVRCGLEDKAGQATRETVTPRIEETTILRAQSPPRPDAERRVLPLKTERKVTAGCLVRVGVYSRAAGREAPKIRAAKRRASTEAQQRINARYSWEKLELMLAANFVPGDLVVTQTYDDENLPEDRVGAQAKLKKFRKELSAARAKRGEEMRMIWATEHKLGDGRWHHHCVINATAGSDYAEILRLWPWGSNIEIRPLIVDKEKSYESLARYMTKEARERPGLRSWSCTRNCRKPEVETFPVPDDETIDVPEDAIILEEQSKRTDYGEFHYVKFLAADPRQLRQHRQKKTHRKT